ncbi:MAG: hypothetical protein IPF79_05895 [Ignavibacteria bacterium]|nr:hypothetical protein [Ignavibacteria bacterium]
MSSNSIPTELNVHLRDVPVFSRPCSRASPSAIRYLPVVSWIPASLLVPLICVCWFRTLCGNARDQRHASCLIRCWVGFACLPFLGAADTAEHTHRDRGYAEDRRSGDLPRSLPIILITAPVLKLLKVKQWIVCLGVARHLIRWAYHHRTSTRLDWHEAVQIKDRTLHL